MINIYKYIDKSLKKFFSMLILLIITVGAISSLISDSKIAPDVLSSVDQNPIASTSEYKWYEIEKVVDGDTVKLVGLGTVRLIGVDTPETVHPTKQVECYGKEATAKMKEFVTKTKVRMEYDDTQDITDKYGRYLVYLYTQDNTFINLELIKQGYAHEYTYSTKYKYQTDFKQAQNYAKDNMLGLWGNICVK